MLIKVVNQFITIAAEYAGQLQSINRWK